jgi:hypothetical protein
MSKTEIVILMLSYGMQEAEVGEWIGGKEEDIKFVWDEIQRIRNLAPKSKQGILMIPDVTYEN